MLLFKVLRQDELSAFLDAGETDGAPVDRIDGFIHLSSATQLPDTLERHFWGADLLSLLAIDGDRLGSDLRWEPARGGEDFPHLYRRLRRADVVWIRPIALKDGRHVLPREVE